LSAGSTTFPPPSVPAILTALPTISTLLSMNSGLSLNRRF
jgi:hypothetical protein